MIRKFTLSILAILSLCTASYAQRCGTDDVNAAVKAADPAAYNRKLNDFTSKWVTWANAHAGVTSRFARTVAAPTGTQVVYQIPVVVHIIHTGGTLGSAYNPTDVQVDSMIAYVNKVYATNYSAHFPDSASGGAYIPIQFILAQRDTNCSSTTGITRNDGTGVTGYTNGGIKLTGSCVTCANEISVKNVNRWPVSQYLNIWIVNKIDSTDGYSASSSYIAGYAYIPPGNPAANDGVVMLAQQVFAEVTAGTTNVTLPHELGHSMGLSHVFGPDGTPTTCPTVTGSCLTSGDYVCDTDPIKQSNFTCPTGINPCTGSGYNNTQHNFMDYSSCQDRFTKGQRSRMLYTLTNDNTRTTLIGSLGSIAPGLSPHSTTCIPSISNPVNSFDAGPTEVRITDAPDSTFSTVNTYLDYPSGGYNTDGKNVYRDLTCKQGATLVAGKQYLFMVRTGNTSAEKVLVYIDYNNDGVFSASEQIYSHTASSAYEADTFSLTLPTTATLSSLITCQPLRMRVISDAASSTPNVCGPLAYGQAEDYSLVIMGSGASTGTVSIALPPGGNPSCIGSTLTFKSTLSAGVTSATYKWFVNGTPNGVTTDSFRTSTITNGSTVYVKVYYPGACGNDSASSNTITVVRVATLAPTVSIALTTGNNPGCAGHATTFTAYPTNGGTTPLLQWYVNGVLVATGATYTATLNAGDFVRLRLTSSSPCASPTGATSNTIFIYHMKLIDSIGIAADSFPTCAGKAVIFSSTVKNAGISPSFQWYVNNLPIFGATSPIFISGTIANGDVIYCVLTANDSCIINHVDTSNTLTATVSDPVIPTASVAITVGSNPGCLDSVIQFTGSSVNTGAAPIYSWFVNGVYTATGISYATAGLKNGDIVTFKVSPSDNGCYSLDTAVAADINMVLSPTPTAPIISLIGNMLVSNIPGTLKWFGPGGLVVGATTQSIHPPAQGYYYAEITNNGCSSKPSNTIGISLLKVPSYNLDAVKVYPNPTSGEVTLDWGNETVNMKVDVYNSIGQQLLHDVVIDQSRKTLQLSQFANGNYFVVLTATDGKIGTISIALKK
ncbi:MAG: T9SS type A sorting domain-containing protein [Taibaiella sp.]|nr:T9SS type A sorting domain-containing protein [Taibaiella sp.]